MSALSSWNKLFRDPLIRFWYSTGYFSMQLLCTPKFCVPPILVNRVVKKVNRGKRGKQVKLIGHSVVLDH